MNNSTWKWFNTKYGLLLIGFIALSACAVYLNYAVNVRSVAILTIALCGSACLAWAILTIYAMGRIRFTESGLQMRKAWIYIECRWSDIKRIALVNYTRGERHSKYIALSTSDDVFPADIRSYPMLKSLKKTNDNVLLFFPYSESLEKEIRAADSREWKTMNLFDRNADRSPSI